MTASSSVTLTADTMTPVLVNALMDQVHDRWFDLESIHHDEETLVIRLGATSRGPFSKVLRFTGVRGTRISDEARIRYYDINEITFDPPNRQAELRSGFPLRITVLLDREWSVSCD